MKSSIKSNAKPNSNPEANPESIPDQNQRHAQNPSQNQCAASCPTHSAAKRFSGLPAVFLLAALLAVTAACGSASSGSKPSSAQSQLTEDPDVVYLSEYHPLELPEAKHTVKPIGDSLYYQTTQREEDGSTYYGIIRRYCPKDDSTETLPFRIERAAILDFELSEDGCLYALVNLWNPESKTSEKKLIKCDSSGSEVYRTDLTDLYTQEKISYINCMFVDSQGRVFFADDKRIFLADGQGGYRGLIETNGDKFESITSLGEDKNGKIYYGSSRNGSDALIEIDFDQKNEGASCQNVPGGTKEHINKSMGANFLLYNGIAAYEYDPAAGSAKKLFEWLDVDLESSSIQSVCASSEETLLAVLYQPDKQEYGYATFTKVPASEAPPRKTRVILGIPRSFSVLQSSVTEFNSQNDTYKIIIREYHQNETDTFSDYALRINADLLTDNCPDLIAIYPLDNLEAMTKNGYFTDLGPYLDQSSVLKREDFIENILEQNTYDGKLISIPRTFVLYSLIGHTAEVGTEMGWTLDQMMSFMEQHPDQKYFANSTEALNACLYFQPDLFVDWNTGKCNYNSPEFLHILEFAKHFDELPDSDTGTRLIRGEFNNFEKEQFYHFLLEDDVTFIGYPTLDGIPGCQIEMNNNLAIPAKAAHKDAAWAFLEYMLLREPDFDYGLYSTRKLYDAQLDKCTHEEYAIDLITGEIALDENGEPIVATHSVILGDFTYEYRLTTPEEAQRIYGLAKGAKPMSSANRQLLSIITEEAASYYSGSKSAAEAADIIQNRIQLFVNENR